MICKASRLILILIGSLVLSFDIALAATPEAQPDPQAYLEADTFHYDEPNKVFTATGHVELQQNEQMVFADKMIYDQAHDQVTATGHVMLVDKTGQVYFADKVRLEKQLKKGLVEQMGLVFSDGSRFAAREGEKVDDNTIVLHDAVYSPCNLCADDPHKPPLWQLRANRIIHDKATQDVIYHNAKMEVKGVPVMYTPYFSHPDPDVVARSGLLMPKFSNDSKKGFMLRNYYYKTFSPQSDATFELSNTQKAGSVLGAEWRQRFNNGRLLFNGSINRSTIRGGSGDDDIIGPEQWRGHAFAEGLFNMDDKWRTGFNLRHVSDDYYLRDFDYSGSDVLVNNLYAERFSGRNYTNISGYYFEDLRPNINQDQPSILPFVNQSFTGRPNDTLGGRWAMDDQFITLFRNGEQSVSRISAIPSWERRDIWPVGLQTTWTNKLRADGYWIRKNSPFDAVPGEPDIDRTTGRLVPSSQLEASYPLIKPGQAVDMIIEPKAALTLIPNQTYNDRIPNEDSRDVQIDISNLFNDSRFPGFDRVEQGSHVSYGVRVGGYHKNGNSAFATIGQSYRLTDDNPFPAGSGLEDDRSDLVGQVETTFYDHFYTDYRFQLNEQDLDDRRHELQAAYMDDGLELRTNYLFAQEIQGTQLPTNRQQLGFSVAKALTPKWSFEVDALQNLADDGGLLRAGSALQYKNECVRVSLRAERDLTDRLTGGSDSRVLFSLGLRNLGGYDTRLLPDDTLYTPFGGTGKL